VRARATQAAALHSPTGGQSTQHRLHTRGITQDRVKSHTHNSTLRTRPARAPPPPPSPLVATARSNESPRSLARPSRPPQPPIAPVAALCTSARPPAWRLQQRGCASSARHRCACRVRPGVRARLRLEGAFPPRSPPRRCARRSRQPRQVP
jgi:hypothetical protein